MDQDGSETTSLKLDIWDSLSQELWLTISLVFLSQGQTFVVSLETLPQSCALDGIWLVLSTHSLETTIISTKGLKNHTTLLMIFMRVLQPT